MIILIIISREEIHEDRLSEDKVETVLPSESGSRNKGGMER